MSWITTHRDKGQSNDEYFLENVIGGNRTIVASSTIKNVYYAAVRENAGPDAGQVFAAIILISRAPNSHHNFGWKSQTEHMGPGDYNAPAKVLDALTETDNEYALEWRAACRKRIEAKAALPKVKPGDVIRLPKGATFRINSFMIDVYEFEFCHHNTFRARTEERSPFLVRLPDWKTSGFELVTV